MLDADALADLIAEVVAEEVGKATAPLLQRIVDLEGRKAEPGPPGEKGEPGIAGEPGKDGADGTNGKDGAGIIDGFVSRDGHLIATLSDGTTRDFGEIIGKDGANGKDGRDGIDLTSFDAVVLDDDRTIELKFVSGDEERVASFKWPTVLDCGVYRAGESYERGDAVSWGGSLWIAQKETDAKPDTADSGWRLAVKRGRDGKDAKNG